MLFAGMENDRGKEHTGSGDLLRDAGDFSRLRGKGDQWVERWGGQGRGMILIFACLD